ncbi:MAG TPA: hypothetical protein VG479_05680 [Gaiellaceae bacterium]|nr:hypothetical protein [Gaiellaceae bacterium]
MLLWLALAAEARAQESPASPGDTASSPGVVTDADAAAPAGEPAAGGASGGQGEQPTSTEAPTPIEPAPAVPVAEPAPAPPVAQPAPAPPVAEPAPAPPVTAEPPPVLAPETPAAVVPPSMPPAGDPGPLDAAPGSDSLVTVLPGILDPSGPALFPSTAGPGLAALTGSSALLEKQVGSHPAPGDDSVRGAGHASDGPLPPPAPPRPSAPSALYVGGGGTSGGSAGGFSVVMLAILAAIFALAAQSLGGLVPLRLEPPRRTPLAVCLERPD